MNKIFPICCTAATLSIQLANAQEQKITKDNNGVERPNIIWYLTEDLSPHFLALFNDGKGCETPNISELASKGMIYPNTYSSASVSSAARTTLITGCYAPRFEGTFHRNIEETPLPEGLRMFPYYLRNAGYFTLNAKKQDYNVILDKGAWCNASGEADEWRTRPDKSKPFFMQHSTMTTHESRLLFTEECFLTKKTKTNPADVVLMPHSQDTELMRYSYATIYDRIRQSDEEFGVLIDKLKADGEFDNTIIMFFGDNGGTLPGTKGYTDNIGLQVPLMVYVPEKWQKKMGTEVGVVRNDLVSFIDFAATVLNMAGVEIPEQMDGVPFLGEGAQRGHESVVCYGDRYDEYYSFNRSIRKGDFRYERNYQPYQPQGTFALYRYNQLAFQEWRELYQKGGVLNEAQSRFFEKQGVEELYDLSKDPHELNNLANDPAFKAKLEELRGDLNSYLSAHNDLSFYPENIIHERAMSNPDTFGKAHKKDIERYISIADLQRLPFKEASKQLKAALESTDEVDQWWALTTAVWFGDEAKSLKSKIKPLVNHERSYIRSKAMMFMAQLGEKYTGEDFLAIFKDCKKDSESLLILNDLTYMIEAGTVKPFAITEKDVFGKFFALEWRMRYINSLYEGHSLSEVCIQKDVK